MAPCRLAARVNGGAQQAGDVDRDARPIAEARVAPHLVGHHDLVRLEGQPRHRRAQVEKLAGLGGRADVTLGRHLVAGRAGRAAAGCRVPRRSPPARRRAPGRSASRRRVPARAPARPRPAGRTRSSPRRSAPSAGRRRARSGRDSAATASADGQGDRPALDQAPHPFPGGALLAARAPALAQRGAQPEAASRAARGSVRARP